MSKPSGYGTVELNGVRPFHVGTNQGEHFCRLPDRRLEDGRPMSLQDYGKLFSPATLRDVAVSGGDIRDFIYSALVSGAEVDGIDVDFTPTQVGYWIDDAEPEEVGKPFKEMLNQLLRRYERQLERLKNVAAPTKTKGPKPKKDQP